MEVAGLSPTLEPVPAGFLSARGGFFNSSYYLTAPVPALMVSGFLSAGVVTVVLIRPIFLASACEITYEMPPALILKASDYAIGSSESSSLPALGPPNALLNPPEVCCF